MRFGFPWLFFSPRLAKTASLIFFGVMLVTAFLLFVLWRTENPRLQAARASLMDSVAPAVEAVAGGGDAIGALFDDLESYADLQSENARLRRELRRMSGWRDAAHRFEEENARLRALNNAKLPPQLSFVTADVIAASGGPYQRSVVVNIGRDDGVADGAPAMDEAGLVGRVVGAGEETSRVLLLTDATSRAPVLVGEARIRALIQGDNSDRPTLQAVLDPETITVGDRVVTSGDGGVFPSGLLVGRVVSVEGRAPRVALASDYRRLLFVKVRYAARDTETPPPGLILRPSAPDTGGN